jgi:phospholipid/cholesterol/gamma-HCH transport system substrate-binding protein
MSARVGLFFLIGLALIWVTFEALHNGRFEKKEGYAVVAPFKSLKELKEGDDVRMAGVKIGAVRETRLTNGRAEAVLSISKDIKIPSDSGAPGFVAVNGTVRTKDAPDLNQIMSDLGSLGQEFKSALGNIGNALGSGSDGQGGLFQKLDKLVTENSTKVSNTMSNLEDITNKIRTGEGTIGKLVNDPGAYNELNSTLAEIRGAANEAKTFIANAQGIVDQVKSGKGTIGALVYDEEAGQNLKNTAKNLRELSEKLNNPNSTFGQLITNDSLIRDAQATLRKVDRAVDGMADQGPITAVGVVANALF